jgi:hypothetical protein
MPGALLRSVDGEENDWAFQRQDPEASVYGRTGHATSEIRSFRYDLFAVDEVQEDTGAKEA